MQYGYCDMCYNATKLSEHCGVARSAHYKTCKCRSCTKSVMASYCIEEECMNMRHDGLYCYEHLLEQAKAQYGFLFEYIDKKFDDLEELIIDRTGGHRYGCSYCT